MFWFELSAVVVAFSLFTLTVTVVIEQINGWIASIRLSKEYKARAREADKSSHRPVRLDLRYDPLSIDEDVHMPKRD